MSDRGDEPTWDGTGPDPWLPDRLEAMADAADAERDTYAAYWAALAAWLATTHERLRASGYDPVSIKATQPDWDASMRRFADDVLYPINERAYERTSGNATYPPDMATDARTRVYTRANTLSGVPDEVYVKVQRETATAIRTGRSGDRLAADLDDLFDTTHTPRWQNRSATVARTESLGALNGGRTDGHRDIARTLGGDWERIWIATLDGRTRPTHRSADGQRAAVNGTFSVGADRLRHPGDPLGSAAEIINCRCTTIMVRAGDDVDFRRRRA